jgi:hypothetical protein
MAKTTPILSLTERNDVARKIVQVGMEGGDSLSTLISVAEIIEALGVIGVKESEVWKLLDEWDKARMQEPVDEILEHQAQISGGKERR